MVAFIHIRADCIILEFLKGSEIWESSGKLKFKWVVFNLWYAKIKRTSIKQCGRAG